MERLRYPFDVLSWDKTPKEIYEKARKIHIAGGHILTTSSGKKYGMISAGPMPNPGYSIKIVNVEDGSNGPVVTIRIQPPRPDEVLIQVISYPYLIGKIAQDTETITVHGLPKSTLEYI